MLTVRKFFVMTYFVFVCGMGFVGVWLVRFLFGVFLMAMVYLGRTLTGDS